MTLQNRLVMITGASAGIGEACAEAFAREGCRLVLAARRRDRLDGLAAKLAAANTARRRTCWNWTCATAWP
jgi:3-hydroxy acid dehydrogenase/malonic semialdehyde reductase